MLARALKIPHVAAHNPADIRWSELPADCIVAMHWEYSQEFELFLREQGFDILVTARHPLDVLVSILQFAPREPATARWLEGAGGSEYLLTNSAPTQATFLNYACSKRASELLAVSIGWSHVSKAIVRYEALVGSPVSALEDIVKALNVEPRASLHRAVAETSIEQMRPRAPHHFWRGQAGGWRSLIVADMARTIAVHQLRAFEHFDYYCDPDPELTVTQAEINWQIANGLRVDVYREARQLMASRDRKDALAQFGT